MEILNADMKYHACFDVTYYDDYAVVGYVLFADHRSETAIRTGQVKHEQIEPYVPGEFYRRELPCLLTAFKQIPEKISVIYIDANVWLGENRKGLGCYLYEALEEKIPVIGISKTSFHDSGDRVVPVVRGGSSSPLFVSSIGIETTEAAKIVSEMHGTFRLPTMVKLADTLSRNEYH